MRKFDKVLTVCSKCKVAMTVEANYEDRNKKYTCDNCLMCRVYVDRTNETLFTGTFKECQGYTTEYYLGADEYMHVWIDRI